MVTAEGQKDADVLLEHRTISLIGDLAGIPADETVDASGCYVIPGAVDVHTHLDMDVGVTVSADDFTTGTRAAACGGTTTVVDFATAYRGESIAEGLANWHAKADGKALIDYAFHMSVTELTRPADDIVAEMGESGITSFKLYMTYPDRLMVSDDVIKQMMIAAEKQNALICLHCEDDTSVTRLRNEALAAGHREPRWHAWSRPPDAEASAVERAVRHGRGNRRRGLHRAPLFGPGARARARGAGARTPCVRGDVPAVPLSLGRSLRSRAGCRIALHLRALPCATSSTTRSCGRVSKVATSRSSRPITARSSKPRRTRD